jgi:hypothetical protein
MQKTAFFIATAVKTASLTVMAICVHVCILYPTCVDPGSNANEMLSSGAVRDISCHRPNSGVWGCGMGHDRLQIPFLIVPTRWNFSAETFAVTCSWLHCYVVSLFKIQRAPSVRLQETVTWRTRTSEHNVMLSIHQCTRSCFLRKRIRILRRIPNKKC